MSPTTSTLDHLRSAPPPRAAERVPRQGRPASAFTRAALQTIGTADPAIAPSLDARWRHVHESVELVVEVAVAGQLFGIHRRTATDPRLDGVERSRDRVRDACADIVQRLVAAHRDLAHHGTGHGDICKHADTLEQRWSHDPDDALTALPVLLARELSEALKDRSTPWDPGAPIATAAGTALALWLLAGPEHDPARHVATPG